MIKTDVILLATINIGSNYLKMTIAQTSSGGNIEILETLTANTSLGKDTFGHGRIELSTIKDVADSLKKFSRVMREYGVTKYRVFSSTGIREAENREYAIAQIKHMTGFEVDDINVAQERFYYLKALRNEFKSDPSSLKMNMLIVGLSSGGLEVSVYEKGRLTLSEHMRLGAFRIRETLSSLESDSNNFAEIINQYVEYKTHFISKVIRRMNIDIVVGFGNDLEIIKYLSGIENGTLNPKASYQENKESVKEIEVKILRALYDKTGKLSPSQIADKYKLTHKQAQILLPSLVIYGSFAQMTGCKTLRCPDVSLNNGVLYCMMEKLYRSGSFEVDNEDIIDTVWYIAEKNGVEKNHASHVAKLALSIYDQTRSIHRLVNKYRSYLEIASILHDVGSSISEENHAIHSYGIINAQTIIGHSDREIGMIAGIAKYHSHLEPSLWDENYRILTFKERIAVSKLSAILKIAESLDFSHTQNIAGVHVEMDEEGDYLNFIIEAAGTTVLEEWEFELKSKFFEQVMGIEPKIRRKM